MGLFLIITKFAALLWGVIVDITVEEHSQFTPRNELFRTKILFPYARILCLVVLGGSCGLELGLGELGAWSPNLDVKSTYSLPLQPLGGGCTMPASTRAARQPLFFPPCRYLRAVTL